MINIFNKNQTIADVSAILLFIMNNITVVTNNFLFSNFLMYMSFINENFEL